MIERLYWGQEQFGGGFCGAGATNGGDLTTFANRGKFKGTFRTMGTIEALLLLTEWHPRALHFPPGSDDNSIFDSSDNPADNVDSDEVLVSEQDNGQQGVKNGSFRFSSWLEPAWRSDRMIWMLLGSAVALAFELGIFDEFAASGPSADKFSDYDSGSSLERARAHRIRRLTLVFVNQTSGRIGVSSMLPWPHWQPSNSSVPTPERTHDDPAEKTLYDMQSCWMDVADLTHLGNVLFFPSKAQTRKIIKTGEYRGLIDFILPKLRASKARFDEMQSTHLSEGS